MWKIKNRAYITHGVRKLYPDLQRVIKMKKRKNLSIFPLPYRGAVTLQIIELSRMISANVLSS